MKKAKEFRLQSIEADASRDENSETADRARHDQRSLNSVAYLGRDCSGIAELAAHGINVVSTGAGSFLPAEVLDVVDAALVDFDLLKPLDRAQLLLASRQRRIPVVVLRRAVAGVNDCVDGGADATVPSCATGDELVAALLSAQKQAKLRYELQRRVDDLEMEVVQAALVERATIVLSSQSRASQADSLRLLRSEARRQRRPMWELAKVVLAADDILAARDSQKSVNH